LTAAAHALKVRAFFNPPNWRPPCITLTLPPLRSPRPSLPDQARRPIAGSFAGSFSIPRSLNTSFVAP